MSINDEIGSMSGSQLHLWSGERVEAISDALVINDKPSDIELDRDVTELSPEIRAAEIARNVYGNLALEFGTSSFRIASILAHVVACLENGKPFKFSRPFDENAEQRAADSKGDSDSLVGFFCSNYEITVKAQELAWLNSVLDTGATAAELDVWGVSNITIQQLLWWQRREGETRLAQHIRAERNGLALPWLARAVRENYANLLRFIDKGALPADAVASFADDVQQVRDLLEFFDEPYRTDIKYEPVAALSNEDEALWAEAFANRIELIAPDARGRWGMLPKQSLARGELRGHSYNVARYLKHIGLKPADFATLPDNFFGRVGDVNG